MTNAEIQRLLNTQSFITCDRCNRPVRVVRFDPAGIGRYVLHVTCHRSYRPLTVTLSEIEDRRRIVTFGDVLVHARIDRHGRHTLSPARAQCTFDPSKEY